MTESLLPPVLQELRDAILAKTPLSPLGPYFHAWQAAAKEFPYLTGCCDVDGDDDPSDSVMLERLAEIGSILAKAGQPQPSFAQTGSSTNEVWPLVDAPCCQYCGPFATAQERQECRRRRGYE